MFRLFLAFLFLMPADVIAVSCRYLNEPNTTVLIPGFKQWLAWEQVANYEPFRKPQHLVQFPVKKAPSKSVSLWVSPLARPEIVSYFSQGNFVLWPQHFLNSNSEVPFFGRSIASQLPVNLTASRSAAHQGLLVTIKTPTNRVHNNENWDSHESTKVDLREDIGQAIELGQHIIDVDRKLGPDASFLILPEVFAGVEKVSGNGFLVRDISVLNDGHYYLPAFSIPYVGREIAERNGSDFESFWQKYYAEALGRVKAKILLRYGIEMDTPNAQNFLIQLDTNLVPTGLLVIRDSADSYFVLHIANALGYEGALKRQRMRKFPLLKNVQLKFKDSTWRFEQAGDLSVSRATLNEWNKAHDNAYLQEIQQELGLTFASPNSLVQALDWLIPVVPSASELANKLLKSEEGIRALSLRQKEHLARQSR